MYLSMILGANFSSESGPEISLNVSLIIRFGGHVTTKKGTTWLFANEKGSHLWQASTPACSNGVAQTVPEALLPPTAQRLSHCPAASTPRQVKAAQEAGRLGASALVLALIYGR
jgi:hypothetical protein